MFGKITLALARGTYMERYRSGHNEAVLKTVCPQGRVGSNPTLSVDSKVKWGTVIRKKTVLTR